ncbi:energy transducer TonB [bacterium]|nr:energy transducer TonB [bacterium]
MLVSLLLTVNSGTIKDVKIVKGVHKTLDGEAQRVVKSMPKWTPCSCSNKI